MFFSVGQWSSASPVDQAHGFDLSDAEGNFTVSYLAKNQEGTTGAYSILKRSLFLCWLEGFKPCSIEFLRCLGVSFPAVIRKIDCFFFSD